MKEGAIVVDCGINVIPGKKSNLLNSYYVDWT